MNSFKRVHAFQIELEFGSVGFSGEEKTGVPGEKPLAAKGSCSHFGKFHSFTFMHKISPRCFV